jgi:phage terminase large subunit
MIKNLQIDKRVFNEAYLPYLYNQNRYLIFYGGAGSGKSYFVAQRYILRLLETQGRNLLVVREFANTNRTSTYAQLVQVINKWNLGAYFKINSGILKIECLLNGNEIVFAGLDNPEKVKSTTFRNGSLTDIWIEEASQISESAFNQLLIRLRGGGASKQIVMSFNPIDINHWLKKRFIDDSRKGKGLSFIKTTYKDNKFMTAEDIAALEDFKYTDPYYYQVYCLGEWGVFGNTVFDSAKIAVRISADVKPVKKGAFIYKENAEGIFDMVFEDRPDGFIKIYKQPIKGQPYVIGGDTAGEGADYFTAQVIDNITGEQTAVLRHRFDSDLYARQVYCLGRYYNDAVVAIEKNFDRYPIKELQRLGYPKQYVTERQDTYTGKLAEDYGFRTDAHSRQAIVSNLIKEFREHSENINDLDTLYEMQTFVRNEKGKPEAMANAHDDLVMSLAIAYHISVQQTDYNDFKSQYSIKHSVKVKWYDDQYKDYYKAKPEIKAELIERWGNPF